MSRKLNIRDIVAGMTWVEDAQVRFDHKDCPAGEDTRARLYVKAVRPKGSWVGHCFNCGHSGYAARYTSVPEMSLDEFLEYAGNAKITGDKTSTIFKKDVASTVVPPSRVAPVTMEQKLWLYKKHIFDEDIEKLGIGSSMPHGFFMHVPFVPPAKGYFRRGFGESTHKYVNSVAENSPPNVFLGTHEPQWVILTEDFISAYRINRDVPEYTAIPCMGTNVTDACLNKLIELSPVSVLVWFDPDTAGRRAQTDAVSKIRSVLACSVQGLIRPDKEAKNMTPDELQTFLRTGVLKK